ncbi:PucR family transcriptional regulator [Mycolicibacterium sp.]|uniref:PucR family transcriptional regulator n=1 Tax=Mycolicibacterium sp. TaxID=2320850 RepID=UPI0037C5E3D5
MTGHAGADTVWLSFETPPTRAQIFQLAGTLSGHVGVSATASGVGGFITVAHEARDTLEAAIKLHPSGGVETFHSRALITTLLASSPRRARRFAQVMLGPLALDSPEAERLRSTLRAYYACGGSKVAASSTLLVHEKTVAYRLRQASRQLGVSIDDHRVDTEAALSVLSVMR